MDHDPSLDQSPWMMVRAVERSRLYTAVWARAYELLVPLARRPVDRNPLTKRDRSKARSKRPVALEIGG
jgi:hypothetical protein